MVQYRQHCNISTFPYLNSLYCLLRLYRRPAAEDYLLCDTGTLALRVHVVMPGRRARAATSDLYLFACVFFVIPLCVR